MTDTSEEDKVMAARLLAPEVRAARIAELEAELARLRLAPFIAYPKMLPDGRIAESAEEEARMTASEPAATPTAATDPESPVPSARKKASQS